MVKAQSPKSFAAVSCRSRTNRDALRKVAGKSVSISRRAEEDESGLSLLIERLKSVVPTISDVEKREVSDLEIMQHAINYIYDLNSVLQRDTSSDEETHEDAENLSSSREEFSPKQIKQRDFISRPEHISRSQPNSRQRALSTPVC